MKGRLQAALLALIGLPFLSTAAVGLVTLRLGHREGALLLFIAFIPTLLGVLFGKVPELLFWLSLISIFSVFVYGQLLRASVSWMFTLIGACLLMAVLSPLITWQFEGLRESFSRILRVPEGVANQDLSGLADVVELQSVGLISGIVALIATFNGISSIVLARWWQSLLYNPGGFGEEFRALRLDAIPAAVLALLSLICAYAGVDFAFWAIVLSAPLLVAALALVHHVVNAKELGINWLIGFYLLAVYFFMPTALILLALIGLLDAVFNLRKRF